MKKLSIVFIFVFSCAWMCESYGMMRQVLRAPARLSSSVIKSHATSASRNMSVGRTVKTVAQKKSKRALATLCAGMTALSFGSSIAHAKGDGEGFGTTEQEVKELREQIEKGLAQEEKQQEKKLAVQTEQICRLIEDGAYADLTNKNFHRIADVCAPILRHENMKYTEKICQSVVTALQNSSSDGLKVDLQFATELAFLCEPGNIILEAMEKNKKIFRNFDVSKTHQEVIILLSQDKEDVYKKLVSSNHFCPLDGDAETLYSRLMRLHNLFTYAQT